METLRIPLGKLPGPPGLTISVPIPSGLGTKKSLGACEAMNVSSYFFFSDAKKIDTMFVHCKGLPALY